MLAAALVVIAIAGLLARGQFQVNPQVQTQVNTGLYGGGVSGSMRYSNWGPSFTRQFSRPMPSEVRYAYIRSGALPSEIRMNQARIGPLAPQGPIAYIPEPRDVWQKPDRPAPPPPQGSAAFTTGTAGTIRYSDMPSSTASAPPAPRAPTSPLMSSPMNVTLRNPLVRPTTMTSLRWNVFGDSSSSGATNGTIRYSGR